MNKRHVFDLSWCFKYFILKFNKCVPKSSFGSFIISNTFDQDCFQPQIIHTEQKKKNNILLQSADL